MSRPRLQQGCHLPAACICKREGFAQRESLALVVVKALLRLLESFQTRTRGIRFGRELVLVVERF